MAREQQLLTPLFCCIYIRDSHGDMKCLNMYDIRMKEENHPECGLSWPYELDDVTRYLRV